VIDGGPRIRKGWLIGGAVLIPALFATTSYFYYSALLRSGTLPPNADSIGIPIFTNVLASPILAGIMLLYAIPAIYRYDGSATLMAGTLVHPVRLTVGLLLYGLFAIALLVLMVRDALTPMPSFERLWLLVAILLALWLLTLRAAVSVQRGPKELRGGYVLD
jgi:hypothetical protein